MKLALALLFSLLLTLAEAAPALKAGVCEPLRQAHEFARCGSNGNDLKDARYRGRLVLLVFGFTHCPEVGPTHLGDLGAGPQDLGQRRQCGGRWSM